MITSTSNPKIKQLVQLQKKKKLRDERGVFLVEGIRMFEETPNELIQEVYASESFFTKHRSLLTEKKHRLEVLSDTVFQKVSETKTPQGILCVVKKKTYRLQQILETKEAHILVLDGLQDPGNVGTIIRTAEAAGVTGIVLSKDTADMYQPKTIRSTMGAIFRMPCVYVDNVVETLQLMKNKNILTYATHLDGKKWYDEVNYTGSIAFLIGNEGNGLREEVSNMADTWIRIPMEGEVESLNAAIATSVVIYEAYRQRRTL